MKKLLTYKKEKYLSFIPLNVIGLARELGLNVIESDELPQAISGFIKRESNNSIFICVNKKHHINRKRFTVAHELGHYALHKPYLSAGIVENRLDRSPKRNEMENEADEFAGNLLMPQGDFELLWSDARYSIEDMGRFFRVSVDAINTRARFLKLLNF